MGEPSHKGYGQNDIYDTGKFDLETWCCELKHFWEGRRNDLALDFTRQCSLEIVSRWMLLGWALISCVTAVTGWFLFRRMKETGGRSAGKPDLFEQI